MKTHLTIVLVIIVTVSVFAQNTNEHANGQGFNSIFQNMKEGKFMGHLSGRLILTGQDGKTIETAFNQTQAQLQIIPDPNNVYDVSRKEYSSTKGDITFTYTTYATANAISITISGQEYGFSFIDGGCDLVFKNLEYEYKPTEKTEQLKLSFTKEIGLSLPKNCGNPVVFIQSGSNLVFDMVKAD